MPAARESRVGASELVMRESRVETVEGDIWGKRFGSGAAGSVSMGWVSGCCCCLAASGFICAKISRCDGSNRDRSIRSGGDGCDDGTESNSGCSGGAGLIRGMSAGRRSALRACRSFCSLDT